VRSPERKTDRRCPVYVSAVRFYSCPINNNYKIVAEEKQKTNLSAARSPVLYAAIVFTNNRNEYTRARLVNTITYILRHGACWRLFFFFTSSPPPAGRRGYSPLLVNLSWMARKIRDESSKTIVLKGLLYVYRLCRTPVARVTCPLSFGTSRTRTLGVRHFSANHCVIFFLGSVRGGGSIFFGRYAAGTKNRTNIA